jgi:hypothetical protein
MERLDVGDVFSAMAKSFAAKWRPIVAAAVLLYALLAGIAFVSDAPWLVAVIRYLSFFWLGGVFTLFLKPTGESERPVSARVLACSPSLVWASLLHLVSIGGLLVLAFGAVVMADVLGLIPMVALLVLVALLFVRWSIVAPVVASENPDVFDAFSLSGDLVKGSGFQVLLTFIVVAIATIPADVVATVVGNQIGGTAGAALRLFIGGAFGSSFSALAAAQIFLQLNSRKPEVLRRHAELLV